jgi:Fe-S oxidoreductase
VYELIYDEETCNRCETLDCLTKCQHMDLSLEQAREERQKILHGKDSRVLSDCLTCYACEEYCPYDNHPFYLIVDRQEEKAIWPAPIPITKQQIMMMVPKDRIEPQRVQDPVVNMCYFPMLTDCVRGRLFQGASVIVGSDIFCNIMWLHFAKNSVIRERLPQMIDNIWTYYLKESGVDEMICYHDECYGTYTHLAPAFGIQVPFKSIHLFEYLTRRLDTLKAHIRPLGMKAAYQRPCSNRLVPETQQWVDQIFQRIGVERVEREYEGENALCCGGGGGNFFTDVLGPGPDSPARVRVREAVETGAEIIAVACPNCAKMLEDAVKAELLDDKLAVMDLAELVQLP